MLSDKGSLSEDRQHATISCESFTYEIMMTRVPLLCELLLTDELKYSHLHGKVEEELKNVTTTSQRTVV